MALPNMALPRPAPKFFDPSMMVPSFPMYPGDAGSYGQPYGPRPQGQLAPQATRSHCYVWARRVCKSLLVFQAMSKVGMRTPRVLFCLISYGFWFGFGYGSAVANATSSSRITINTVDETASCTR